ncbi:VanZ family protein [Clostridium beijerinckii]|uniref:Glycopeptide antibiotics resistance protein n=1 Tax=Clostridium beijerinckii TaxID=1520 RepID=A0AAX0AYE4_CLOBE|nr:VanZ family protein [Clostridium beijerinckii]MBA8935068.1 glycopeptide antibiotics resistance protein [Clostridium beijerinckii]MBC2459512.1 VanZ family protein [Clostridium beijerinckii]MBC2477018.1 VanZ family protein [Clostridium beijerinckii]MCI1580568.1 VanZ family protein [Clostridium beijerinckii]MCI1583755.1 VanZ family protein [Clostridium beijerinckii]
MKNEQERIPKWNEVLMDNSEVMNAKLSRFILMGTLLYTILILYFMFLGFSRLDHRINNDQYTFMFVPEGVPLRFPKLTMSWLYDFGNIAAFIPFGIVIPLLYRIRFRKFITLFILVISFLEVLQSLTFMGTFDIMDIISNTLGAIMGFVGYRVGFSSEITFKKLVASAVSILMLIVGVMVVSETIDYGVHVNERIGPVQALNEANTTSPITNSFSTFTVEDEVVQPKFNLFDSNDGISKEYLFNLGKKNLWLYANYGIPDGEEYKGSVTIMINGEEFTQFTDQDKDIHMMKLETFFDSEIKEVKIIVTGNAKVWDVSVAEIKHWWD